MLKKPKLLILLFCLTSYVSFSQEDVSHYFDDGGISQKKNIFTINLIAPVNGDFTFGIQRRFTDRFYLDAGLGFLTNAYRYNRLGEMGQLFYEPEYFGNGGRSFFINPKLEMSGDDRYGVAFGLKYRNRTYFFETDKTLIISDYTITLNYSYTFGKFMIFDIGTGIGQSVWDTSLERLSGIAMPVDVKLGVIF